MSENAVLLAVQAVLDDPGFKMSSPLAANAVKSAKYLQQWSQLVENRACFKIFFSIGE